MQKTKLLAAIILLLLLIPTFTGIITDTSITVILKDSNGIILPTGSLRYYSGGWQNVQPNSDGTFTINTNAASLSYEMMYEYGVEVKSNIPTTTDTVIFQTVLVQVRLKNSQGNFISDIGTVQYYSGGWYSFGTTNNGIAVKELLPGNYTFRINYEHGTNDKAQDIQANSIVDFQTVKAEVHLKNSVNELIDEGTVQYYSGGWFEFGTTNNGIVDKELLPQNYTFRMTYEHGSYDKAQDIGTNSIIEFQTVRAEAHLKNSMNALIDEGIVQYYSGGWYDFGTTNGGIAAKELLPKNYTFRMTYEHGSNDKAQDISTNNIVEFQTVRAEAHLKNSMNALIDEGTVQYYSGGWYNFGITNDGIAVKELLPRNYTFRMTYEFGSNDKAQDISSSTIIEFQTVQAETQLKNSNNEFIDQGIVQYYSGGWHSFGTTSNGISTKELLPKSYTFRMSYEYGSNDKAQDIGNNKLITFNTSNVTVQLKNGNGNLIDPGIVTYYSGGWHNFGSTLNGEVSKQLLPNSYTFKIIYNGDSQQKAQDVSIDPLVIFITESTALPPELTIYEPSDSITSEQSVTVSGSVDNPTNTTVKINNQSVSVLPDGMFSSTVSLLEGNNTISITAINNLGLSTSKTINIFRAGNVVIPPDPATVAPPLDSTVVTTMASATEFLYTGSNPIQTGVDTGTINPVRVAVIRGKVLNKNNQPLPGVKIDILNHPEFGQTISRNDGMYDMAVNGGGYLTVNYSKDSYLNVQRQLDAPWQDYVIADSVVMIQLDPAVTNIDFADSIEVAAGSVVSDENGSRQASLMFKQGTIATMVLPDGTTQQLSSINVRATEYTVGENGPASMPAVLPPTSGYTYCVELSTDEAIQAGAKSVEFDKSVSFYVQNFLGFPVGSIVPVGYYDKEKGEWIASDNGRVIKILDIINNKAELDINGDGIADDSTSLAQLGIVEQEEEKLASQYSAGESLWRVEVNHFSPWDFNWPFGVPLDAVAPNQNQDNNNLTDNDKSNDECGSIIKVQNQTIGEGAEVLGTPFKLYYSSGLSRGYLADNIIPIKLSGNSIPSSLLNIVLQVKVAGRIFEKGFSPKTNLNFKFKWDGKDAYGRLVQGCQPAFIKIGYMYRFIYLEPNGIGKSYALVGTQPYSTNYSSTITLWQGWSTIIGHRVNNDFGGWSPGIVHNYDLIGRTLYEGNGTIRHTENVENIVRVAIDENELIGDYIYGGDVSIGPDGSIYVVVNSNKIIRKKPDGTFSTIFEFPSDRTDANIEQIDVGNDGAVYFTDLWENKIYKVNTSGDLKIIAGLVGYGYSGDGGPVDSAKIAWPTGIAVAADGTIYFADEENNVIRRISTEGIITTFAGTGEIGFSGDGGPALNAKFWSLEGIDLGPDGSLYVIDVAQNRVRKISPDGIITTVAGSGKIGYSTSETIPDDRGDGGPATSARLIQPTDVAVGRDGSIYIADQYAHHIRVVTPDGNIYRLAGLYGDKTFRFSINHDDRGGFNFNDGPAAATRLSRPTSMAVGPDNALYFTEIESPYVRKVESNFDYFNNNENIIASIDGNQIYEFNSEGKHLRTLDALTGKNIFEFKYDSLGLLSEVIDIDSLITTIKQSSDSHPIAIISPFGDTTKLNIGPEGYLSSIISPANEKYSYKYSSLGLLTQMSNPKNNVKNYQYDSLGYLIEENFPNGGVKQLSRTLIPNGFIVTLATAEGNNRNYKLERYGNGSTKYTNTDNKGLETIRSYNSDGSNIVDFPDGNIVNTKLKPGPRFGMEAPLVDDQKITTPSNLVSHFSNNRVITQLSGNKITGMVDSLKYNGKISLINFDGNQNLYTTTSPEGRQSFTYTDSLGRAIQSIVSGITPVNFTYNDKGFLIKTEQGDRQTNFTYNSKGYLETVTDPMGRNESIYYDSAGRVTTQILPNGEQILYSYDANGNLTSITPPGKPSHTFEYNNVDLTDNYNPPVVPDSAGGTKYIYNLDKQLISTIFPDSSIINIVYDTTGCGCGASSRPSKVIFDRGTNSFSYDTTSGNLKSVISPDSEKVSFDYDGSLLTNMNWNGVVNGNVGFTYNNDFKLASENVNGTNNINFSYDHDGLLTGAGSLSISHDPQNGLLIGTALGNINSSYTYNSFGEVKGATYDYNSTPLYSTSYALDSLGRIKSLTETIEGTTDTYNYEYNAIGYLVNVKKNGFVISEYEYDQNGNRVKYISNNDTTTGIYDDQDRMLSYGNANYIYGKRGDLQKKIEGNDTTKYDYDDLGNLKHVYLPDGTKIDYLIDANNHRIAKLVNGQIVKKWLYADGSLPIAELDSANNVKAFFGLGYIVKNDTIYRVITDHLGSIRLIVNTASGDVVQHVDYDAFGNITYLLSHNEFLDFTFAGGLYDSDTKLVRFGARDYDSEIGRWTSKDPILFYGRSSNLYKYVNNDPINYIDNEGLWGGIDDIIALGGGFVTGLGSQLISDIIAGEFSSWQQYLASGIGGAVTGETLLYTANPWLAGTAGGAATNFTKFGLDYLSGEEPCFNLSDLVADMGIGALSSLLANGIKIPGLNKGRGSLKALSKQIQTKINKGLIDLDNVSGIVRGKMFGYEMYDDAIYGFLNGGFRLTGIR